MQTRAVGDADKAVLGDPRGTPGVTQPTGAAPTRVVEIASVTHEYAGTDGGVVQVLDDVSLDVFQGEFVSIVGPSGCGKTTLINLISGLEGVQTGRVTVEGAAPRAGSSNVGYLFANDSLLPWRTVVGNVKLGLERLDHTRRERHDIAMQSLSDVGLAQFADVYPSQISHGMRQRAAIARTLAARPRILLLDEPFSALDAQTRLALQDRFTSLWQSNQSTVVLITHDLHEAVALGDRVVMFSRRPGRIKRVLRIDLERPRRVTDLQADDRYHHYYEQLWGDLQDEVDWKLS